jgi:uncharacterized protein
MNTENKRLHVVDALRGFAIISIMLLHNIEHFDFYYTPQNLPSWMPGVDKVIWDTLFFLFGGKSYAIFALLFGLTFFIQSDNQAKKGKDFRGRFAWRMVILFVFAIINSAFYEGDILMFYALIALFIIPVAKFNNKTIFWIAVFCMFQPYEWYAFVKGVLNPDMHMQNPASWAYFNRMGEYITGGSIINTWIGNLTNGRIGVFIWNWEEGRVFQTYSLFLFGMLAGRTGLFLLSEANKQFWKKTLIIASALFVPLFFIKASLGGWISSIAIRRPLATIETSWTNMAFMLILVSGFVLLFQTNFFNRVLKIFSPIGRMSLSNYIIQSVIGSCIYYGFGLALYQYTGATYSILIGITLAVLQGMFCTWWFRKNNQGPLEIIWHKATWLGSK